MNRWRATVKAFRYLTTKTGPWCECNFNNMAPNRASSRRRDWTLDAGNSTRVNTRPYRLSTPTNSEEFESDTIYVCSDTSNFKAFKSLNFMCFEFMYILLFSDKSEVIGIGAQPWLAASLYPKGNKLLWQVYKSLGWGPTQVGLPRK